MKISKSVILGLVISSAFAVGAIAADKKKEEDRKPAAACVISANRNAVIVSGTCAEEIGAELSDKGVSKGTISCSRTNCSIAVDGAAGGGGGGDQGAGGR